MNVQLLLALGTFFKKNKSNTLNVAKAMRKVTIPLVETNGNRGCNKLSYFTKAE